MKAIIIIIITTVVQITLIKIILTMCNRCQIVMMCKECKMLTEQVLLAILTKSAPQYFIRMSITDIAIVVVITTMINNIILLKQVMLLKRVTKTMRMIVSKSIVANITTTTVIPKKMQTAIASVAHRLLQSEDQTRLVRYQVLKMCKMMNNQLRKLTIKKCKYITCDLYSKYICIYIFTVILLLLLSSISFIFFCQKRKNMQLLACILFMYFSN